jgi:hypothetical protein
MDALGIGAVSDLVKDAVDKIWPDKTEVQKQQTELMLAQIQASAGMSFRDAAGWVCVCALAITYIIRPVTSAFCAYIGHPIPDNAWPLLDNSTLLTLLLSLLGIGAMHMNESIKTQ